MSGPNNRKDDASVTELLGMMRSLHQDFQSQARLLLEVKGNIDKLFAVFPEGKLTEARIFIENGIIDMKDSREFRQSLRKGLALWGAVGVVPIVIYALWEYFKIKVRQ